MAIPIIYANKFLPHWDLAAPMATLKKPGGKRGTGNPGCCVVVPGTTMPRIAVLPIATTMRPIIVTTTTVFELCAVLPALFLISASGWESTGIF